MSQASFYGNVGDACQACVRPVMETDVKQQAYTTPPVPMLNNNNKNVLTCEIICHPASFVHYMLRYNQMHYN